VQAKKDGRMHVFHETGHNPTDDILRLAVEKNWGLYEIRPGRLSLEQVFLELTTDAGDSITTEAPAITDSLEGRA
jgi:ABC-2 type transport system ATP-binding protein